MLSLRSEKLVMEIDALKIDEEVKKKAWLDNQISEKIETTKKDYSKRFISRPGLGYILKSEIQIKQDPTKVTVPNSKTHVTNSPSGCERCESKEDVRVPQKGSRNRSEERRVGKECRL